VALEPRRTVKMMQSKKVERELTHLVQAINKDGNFRSGETLLKVNPAGLLPLPDYPSDWWGRLQPIAKSYSCWSGARSDF